MDTRAYRLEACKTFLNGCFDVDMASINDEKRAIFNHVLQNPASKCKLATQPIPEVFFSRRLLDVNLWRVRSGCKTPDNYARSTNCT